MGNIHQKHDEHERHDEGEEKHEEKEKTPSDEIPSNTDSGDDGLGGGWIALIVIGSVAVAGGIAALLVWLFVFRKKKLNKGQLGSLVNPNTPSNFQESEQQN